MGHANTAKAALNNNHKSLLEETLKKKGPQPIERLRSQFSKHPLGPIPSTTIRMFFEEKNIEPPKNKPPKQKEEIPKNGSLLIQDAIKKGLQELTPEELITDQHFKQQVGNHLDTSLWRQIAQKHYAKHQIEVKKVIYWAWPETVDWALSRISGAQPINLETSPSI